MPGMYLSNGTCSICPAGRTSLTFGSLFCESTCDYGYFSTSSDLKCNPCPSGKYSSSTGSDKCTLCPQGKYTNTTGTSSCSQCPDQLYTTTTGSVSISQCTQCSPGYSFLPNSTACSSCSAGKFSLNGECISCGKGSYSTGASTSCQFCPSGRWSNSTDLDSQEKCNVCPVEGAKCDSGSIFPYVLAGWYRDLTDSADSVLFCIPQCAAAYQGRACNSCSLGYFRLGSRCRVCLPAVARYFIIVVDMAFLAFISC
jgi:hypothetical protein